MTPTLIPRPKQVTLSGERVALTPQTVIQLSGPGTDRAERELRRAIEVTLGFTPKIKRVRRHGLNVPKKPEGYALVVGSSKIALAGRDDLGTLWAVQTLRQLVDPATKSIHAAEISDWPSFNLRGVHLFHGKDALRFHQKLIDQVFSPLKLNTLVLEIEHLRWDTAADVAPSWGGTKAAVSEEIKFAAERGITTVPLVQGLGHLEILLGNPKNLKFAEDESKPNALQFTNPAAVNYLTKIFEEAAALFPTSAIHFGLDEVGEHWATQTKPDGTVERVQWRGRFPEKSKNKTLPELFLNAANHWHGFAKRHRRQMWMWADMAMHPSEVSPSFGTAPTPNDSMQIRRGLPKDIVLFDWQYSARETYPSLSFLKKAGFSKLVAATWYDTEGIQRFSQAAAAVGAWGGLQTTWCGYESKEAVLTGEHRRQFTAMVVAAEHFWNGGANEITWDAEIEFQRLYGR